MKTRYLAVTATALLSMATASQALEWGGYARVGPGQKQNSGPGTRCFDGRSVFGSQAGAPGHGGIGRLGNECATYGEFALSQTMKAGGVDYKALLMTNFSSNGGSEADGLVTKVNQLYVEGTGYDIAPDLTFWIGRRFYHRADVHFDDSFYVNMSGTGAGVDGIKVGGGSLSFAAFRTGDDNSIEGSNSGTRLNIDLEKLPVNPGGTLRLTGTFTKFNGNNGENGAGLGVQHIQSGLFGGADNTLWVQYAQGSAGLDGNFSSPTDGSDAKRWRIADSLAWLKGPLTGQTLFHYGQAKRDNGPTEKFWSIAGRVGYAVTNNFKMQGELGHAQNKLDGSSTRSVTKLTIAPTLTVGPNYYDRPELRLYVSHFIMNGAYQQAYSQEKKNKTAIGFQAEIWF